MADNKKIRVQQIKSVIGYDRRQRATVRGLGLRRIRQVVEVEDTPATRGMSALVRNRSESASGVARAPVKARPVVAA
jgi:large subunit ribosomal protein L30